MTDLTDWSVKETVGHFTVLADDANAEAAGALVRSVRTLAAKAKALVETLDEREKYHGSLIGQETLMLVNDLRLELAKWK
jgi:hypothetical protein